MTRAFFEILDREMETKYKVGWSGIVLFLMVSVMVFLLSLIQAINFGPSTFQSVAMSFFGIGVMLFIPCTNKWISRNWHKRLGRGMVTLCYTCFTISMFMHFNYGWLGGWDLTDRSLYWLWILLQIGLVATVLTLTYVFWASFFIWAGRHISYHWTSWVIRGKQSTN